MTVFAYIIQNYNLTFLNKQILRIILIMFFISSQTCITFSQTFCDNPPNCVLNPEMKLPEGTPPPTSGDLTTVVKCPGWNVAYGTPTYSSSGSIWMWSYNGVTSGEGIYTCYNFQKDHTYKLCLSTYIDIKPWHYGYSRGKFYIQISNGNFTRPTNSASQVIASWNMVDTLYTPYTFTFKANDTYKLLWLAPFMAEPPATGWGGQYSLAVKNVRVEEINNLSPSISASNDTLTINNPPLTDGYWSWNPKLPIIGSNSDSSQIKIQICSTTIFTVDFISDCKICDSYSLSDTIDGAPIEVKIIADDTIICSNGDSINLTASFTNNNGAFTYSWNNGKKDQQIKVLPTTKTTYTVTVTNQNGCSGSNNIVINISPAIDVEIIADKTDICPNCDSINLTANFINNNGVFTYLWNNGKKDQQIKVLPTATSTYIVTVTNQNGCSDSDNVVIYIFPMIKIKSVIQNISCTAENDASISITGTGGTPPYSYIWDNGDTTTSIDNLSEGNYEITIKDKNNCETKKSYTISKFKSTVTSFDASCHNTCNGSVNIKTVGGVAPYKYIWSNGADTTANINNLCSGNYSVTVYDAKACSNQFDITINFKSYLKVDIESENVKCNGNKTGKIKLTAKDGAPDYQYIWKDGINGKERDTLPAGLYYFTVYDNNGCQLDSSVQINEAEKLSIKFANIKQSSCYDSCNGELKVNANGGVSPYKYYWNNNSHNDSITALCAGVYKITIKDKNNCVASSYFTLEKPTPLYIETILTNSNCIGDCDGNASVIVKGGTAPYSFVWSNGDNSQTVTHLCPNVYNITVSDSKNCNIKSSVQININSTNPKIDIKADKTLIVRGSSTNLHLNKLNLYSYKSVNNDDINQTDVFNPIVNPTISKYYYALLTDQYNCSFIDSIRIEVIEPDCEEPYIYVPSAFTPNGDNQNDILYFRSNNVLDFHFSVFDRWGEKVFETYNQSIGWDGTYKDEALPQSVYVYYYELTCPNGYKLFKKGNITLMR